MTADWPAYGSLQAATDASDLVITGTPLGSREDIECPASDTEDPLSPQYGLDDYQPDCDVAGVPRTIAKVKVTKVIKGTAKVGDILDVTQPSGTDSDGVKAVEASTVLLKDAQRAGTDEFLLLLLSSDDGTYTPINPASGMLGVGGQQVAALSSDGRSATGATLQAYAEAVD